jgi:hypothetical protein
MFEEVIKDAQGRIIGYLIGNRVYDRNRALLGWSDSSGTYTRTGRRILLNDLPGILLCGEV